LCSGIGIVHEGHAVLPLAGGQIHAAAGGILLVGFGVVADQLAVPRGLEGGAGFSFARGFAFLGVAGFAGGHVLLVLRFGAVGRMTAGGECGG
jgi:hypothetical protein